MSRKRGNYLKYLQGDNPLAKVPRQTEWNRSANLSNPIGQSSVFNLVSSLCATNNVYNVATENDVSELTSIDAAANDTNYGVHNNLITMVASNMK